MYGHICHICDDAFSPGKNIASWTNMARIVKYALIGNTIVTLFAAKYRISINALLKGVSDFSLH